MDHQHPQGTGSHVQGTTARDDGAGDANALLASATIATVTAMVKRMMFDSRMLWWIADRVRGGWGELVGESSSKIRRLYNPRLLVSWTLVSALSVGRVQRSDR